MTHQPSDIELLTSLALGELDAEAAAAVRARIEGEPALRQWYDSILDAARFLAAEPESKVSASAVNAAKKLLRKSRPGMIDRLSDGLRQIVAALDFDSRLTPAVAGIRSASGTAQVAFSCEAADLDLEISPCSADTWLVEGQIDADEGGDWSVTIMDAGKSSRDLPLEAKDGAFRTRLPAGSTRIEHLLSLPAEQREQEAEATELGEPVLLELVDEVRDLVMSDLDRALAMGEVLRLVSDRLNLPTARARARSVWAHALNYANRFDEAIVALDEASAIARENDDPLEDARANLAKAQSLARLGRFEDAVGACVYAEQIFEAASRPELALRAVTNHAIILRMLGRWGESVDRFDRALQLSGHDQTLSAQIQSNLAETLLELGRFKDAEDAFRQSYELLELSGMERVAAIVRGNLADLLGRQGRLSESIRQFEHARRFFERDRASGDLARIEAELADVFAATGLIEEAIALYTRASEALKSTGLAAEHARALTGLGALLIDTEPSAAGEVLERAGAAWQGLGNEQARTRTDLLRAKLALRQQDSASASRLAALSNEPTSDSPVNKIVRRTILAGVLDRTGQAPRAQDMLREALEIAEELGLPPVRADLHHRLGRSLAAEGRTGEALGHYRRSIEEIERIRGALQGDRFRAAFLGDHSLIYQDAADAMLDSDAPGAVVEAFELTERARSRALLETVQGGVELAGQLAGSATDEDRELLDRLASGRTRLNYLYSRIDPSGDSEGHGFGGEWLRMLHEAEAEVEAVETRLSSSRVARGVLAPPMPAAELTASIPDGSATLVYARSHDGLVCYCLRNRSVRLVRLPTSYDELDESAAAFGFQLRRVVVRGQVDSGRARRRQVSSINAGRLLYNTVFGPVEPLLKGCDRLTIVPTGGLHAIPFSSLHDGERFLIERYRVSRLPSASLGAAIAPASENAPQRALVVGAPDRFAPEIRAEASAVAGALPEAELLLDENAAGDQVIDAMRRARIIHIASHGMFPPGNPLGAALKMADRWVTAREIFALQLSGAVVVLSGCETARAEVDRGEESYGFVRAFLAAGAGGGHRKEPPPRTLVWIHRRWSWIMCCMTPRHLTRQSFISLTFAAIAFSTQLASGTDTYGDEPLADQGILELFPGADISAVSSRYGFTTLDAIPSRGTYLVALNQMMTEDAFELLFLSDPEIDHSELNFTSGDAGPGTQSIFLFTAPGAYQNQPVREALGLEAAHATVTGSGVIIAVIDSGIDPTHPILAGSIAPGGIEFTSHPADPMNPYDPGDFRDLCNGVDDDLDGLSDETVGHGTAVAGLALMVAPGAQILPIRVLNDEGAATAFRVAKAIFYAIDQGADVINLSLGSLANVEIIEDAVDEAVDLGVIVTASMGNAGSSDEEFPAALNKVAGVAATDNAGVLAGFSNRNDEVNVCAPGVDLVSSIPTAACGTALPGSAYGEADGTSLAAPLVAGTAALLIEKGTVLRWDNFRGALRQTCDDIESLNPGVDHNDLGMGLLNVAAAVAWDGPCHADLAEDDALDISDVLAFLTLFAAQDPDADFAEPRGSFDISDVLAFLGYFAAGCPADH
eukprot:g5835.t1